VKYFYRNKLYGPEDASLRTLAWRLYFDGYVNKTFEEGKTLLDGYDTNVPQDVKDLLEEAAKHCYLLRIKHD
jgi:hypothetical protein